MTAYMEQELRMMFKENNTVTIDVQINDDECQQYICESFDEAKRLIELHEHTTNVYF